MPKSECDTGDIGTPWKNADQDVFITMMKYDKTTKYYNSNSKNDNSSNRTIMVIAVIRINSTRNAKQYQDT
jgi:hypothetical protein